MIVEDQIEGKNSDTLLNINALLHSPHELKDYGEDFNSNIVCTIRCKVGNIGMSNLKYPKTQIINCSNGYYCLTNFFVTTFNLPSIFRKYTPLGRSLMSI